MSERQEQVQLSNLVEAVDVADDDSIQWVDVRVGTAGRAAFEAAHLPGAVYADLEKDLSAPVDDPKEGGRHPLPSLTAFGEFLGRSGIGPGSRLVAYDASGGAKAAARFWWMMRAIGHPQIGVLNGGIQAAIAAGVPPTSAAEAPAKKKAYPVPEDWLLPRVQRDAVSIHRIDSKKVLIDVRSKERFRGENEAMDPVAGHIPGATNFPFADHLDADGRFLPVYQLRELYDGIMDSKTAEDVVVHCGSGVTACHTLLALDAAGYPIPSLYVGSWSEWCRSGEPRNP